MDKRGKWIWICSENEHPVLGCSPTGREPDLIPRQRAKETSLPWFTTKFCSWRVKLGTEEGPLHRLQSRWSFKEAGALILPSFLTTRPRSRTAIKHSSFAWESCTEQSLQGTATKDKSFWGEGENETKAQSWIHKDIRRMHLLIRNSSQSSQACP